MSRVVAAIACVSWFLTSAIEAEPAKIPHGTVELVSSLSSIQPGSAVPVGLHFQLEPGWHIYWKNPGDSGQPPRLTWKLPKGLTAGEIEWPAPKRLPVGPLLDYGYEGDVLLPITLAAAADLPRDGAQTLDVNLRVLICRETCMPGKAALSLTLPVRSQTPAAVAQYAKLFSAASAAKPESLPANWKASAHQSESEIELSVTGAPSAAKVDFIPAHANQIENAAAQKSTPIAGGSGVVLKRPAEAKQDRSSLEGLLYVSKAGTAPKVYNVSAAISRASSPANAQNLLSILLFAFGGGLILNLMPCVFPVLSIKVISLLEHSRGERSTVRISAALYTLGVLVSFWILVGVLLALRGAGRGLGWGFQLQSPGFVAFLIFLLFVLALSLLGVFEIGTSVMNVGGALTQRGKYSGSFFTGVLATVVATPCTAPLMGVAVGFALSQPPAVCVLVFTVMAVGLASPFLILSAFPQLGRFLPRPGAWMETLKQLMAFPVFATVIWLLWVIGQQIGVNQLAVILMSLLVLSISGWIAGRWPNSKGARAVALAIGLAVCIACSTTLTPVQANAASEGQTSGLKWEKFTPEKLAAYRASGKPVLVDYTAAWCLTCQVNDRVVFHSAQVEQHLNHSDIALLRADWTSYDPVITESLSQFGRSGIPFYVLYGGATKPDAVTLPDGVLTPSVFLENLAKLNL